MPRRNRYHLTGLIWHITHRCHNKEWLFANRWTRNRYRYWLFESRKRYHLSILNYVITSNHVHLLVYDRGIEGMIERSMQLTQGRIAQEYNQRHNRKGAFWQDRYHATAVESGKHLQNCFLYIDRNMIRAGVVKLPWQWEHSGAWEIRRNRTRYCFLDIEQMLHQLGFSSLSEINEWQQFSALNDAAHAEREPLWTNSVAVGSSSYLQHIAQKLKNRLRKRKLVDKGNAWVLEEDQKPYMTASPKYEEL